MGLGDGIARAVVAVIVHRDVAAGQHQLDSQLGLRTGLLVLLQLGVLLDEAFEVHELVLDGLLPGEGLECLLLDGDTRAPALAADLHEVGSGAAGL